MPRQARVEPSLAELAVLGVLADGPAHGWAVAAALAPDGAVGRVWSCSRPLVYRALEGLAERGLARVTTAKPSSRGPARHPYALTAAGRRALGRWRTTPVEHVREVRAELMLKLLLLDRAGLDLTSLLTPQREVLARTERHLERAIVGAEGFERTLALGRLANARAALSFVEALLDRSPGEPVVYRSIGIVRSPHVSLEGMPLQAVADQNGAASIEIEEPYRPALQDLEGFSHVWIVAHLHEITGWEPLVPTFLHDARHGALATRSPRRPNPIGLSLARIAGVRGDGVDVAGIDLLDGTPVLDLKPYVPLWDSPEDEPRIGWFEGRAEQVFERRSDERFGRRTRSGG